MRHLWVLLRELDENIGAQQKSAQMDEGERCEMETSNGPNFLWWTATALLRDSLSNDPAAT